MKSCRTRLGVVSGIIGVLVSVVQAQSEEDIVALTRRALQQPVDPWHNPDIEVLVTLLKKEPERAVDILSATLRTFDSEGGLQFVQAKRAVQLLGVIPTRTALAEADVLYTLWRGPENRRVMLRRALVHALDSNWINAAPGPVARRWPHEARIVLAGWLEREEDHGTLEIALRVLSAHALRLNADLARKLSRELSPETLLLAKRKMGLNRIEDSRTRCDRALEWLDEILGALHKGESTFRDIDGSEATLIHFLFAKTRADMSALRGHTADLRSRSEECIVYLESERSRIGRAEPISVERTLKRTHERNTVTLMRKYFLAALRDAGEPLAEEELQALEPKFPLR